MTPPVREDRENMQADALVDIVISGKINTPGRWSDWSKRVMALPWRSKRRLWRLLRKVLGWSRYKHLRNYYRLHFGDGVDRELRP